MISQITGFALEIDRNGTQILKIFACGAQILADRQVIEGGYFFMALYKAYLKLRVEIQELDQKNDFFVFRSENFL